MGKDLHYSIFRFFENALNQNNNVDSWTREDTKTDCLYLVKRNMGGDILIHVSDSYRYTLNDYYQKPNTLGKSSFIYIARPEAAYDWSIADIAKNDKISIGKFGAVMGALHKDKHWLFIPKERREDD
jgi:hypothetical protein